MYSLFDPRLTPRQQRLADVAPATVRQALANIRSAIVSLERTGEPRLVDALLHLRSAEGKLDRLAGC